MTALTEHYRLFFELADFVREVVARFLTRLPDFEPISDRFDWPPRSLSTGAGGAAVRHETVTSPGADAAQWEREIR
jgi:hypothetical protein